MAIGDWFKHDIYCLQDDRLFTLVSRFGAEGYAVFFHTIEAMYANAGNPIYDMTVRRIAFDLSLPYDKVLTILDFASSESCHHLIHSQDDGGYVSSRVIHEVSEQNEKRQRYSNMGRASAEHRLNVSSNVGSTQVEHKLNAGSTDKIREDKNRKDCNSSSPLQEVSNKNKRNLNNTGTPTIASPEPSKELMLEADNPIEKPVFITIISKNGKEVPIYQDMVDMWKDAYRAVDVEGQLREMKAWSVSNEAERKTEKGMIRFINNWLSREQDKAGRPNGKNERNDFYGGKYIKGTDIKMDLTAKGADRSRYTNQPALEDLL